MDGKVPADNITDGWLAGLTCVSVASYIFQTECLKTVDQFLAV